MKDNLLDGDAISVPIAAIKNSKDSVEEEGKSLIANQHNSVQGDPVSINTSKKSKTNKSSKKQKNTSGKNNNGETDTNENENDYSKDYRMYKKPQT